MSNSRPRTALVRPTSNVKSGRKRVRAYHSLSPLREKSESYRLEPADVTWSNRPLIVTFGVGAWAYAAGATSPRMATRQATTATVLRILPPQVVVRFVYVVAQKRHHQQKQTSDNGAVLPRGLR